MTWEVRTEPFCGPVDVLCRLVASKEIDLWQISLHRLMEDFLEAIAAVDLDAKSEFAHLVSTLIELKSRRLLPDVREIDLDEELALYTSREQALARRIEGSTFGRAARIMRAMFDRASLAYPRTAGPDSRFADVGPDPFARVGPSDLTDALRRLLVPRAALAVDLRHLRAPSMSIDEAIRQCAQTLMAGGRVSFRSLAGHLTERIDIVMYFLAVLELYHSGFVELEQSDRFGEIGVTWTAGPSTSLPSVEEFRGEDAA